MSKTTLPKLPLRTEKGDLLKPKSLRECRFSRTVVYVCWDAGLRRWITRIGGGHLLGQVAGVGRTRDEQVSSARIALRTLWTEHGIPGQLWVQNRKTGQFSKTAEATYGLDPKASKG